MVRILVRALVKGDQLGLFGAKPPEPPKPVAPGTPVNVKAHMRATAHGVELVKQHERHVEKKPGEEPEGDAKAFDAKAFAREVFRLKRAELDERLKGLPEGDPRRKVINDELERRGAKREKKAVQAPANEAGEKKPPAGPATAPEPTPKEKEAAAHPEVNQDWDKPQKPEAGPDAHHKRMDDAMETAKPGAWGPLVEIYSHDPETQKRLAAWLDEYAPDATTARMLLDAKDSLPWRMGLDEVARRAGVKKIAKAAPKPEVKAEPEPSPEPSRQEQRQEERSTDETPKVPEKPEPAPAAEPERQEERQEEKPAHETPNEHEWAQREAEAEGKLGDVGEVLWGARKYKWKRGDLVNPENLDVVEAEGEELARKVVNKKSTFGTWDHEVDQQNGDTPGASHMKAKLVGLISPEPAPEKEARRWYVEGADWLKRELDQCHTVQDVEEFLQGWGLMAQGMMVDDHEYTAKELIAHLAEAGVKPREDDDGRGYSNGTAHIHDDTDRTPYTYKFGDKTIETSRAREYRIEIDDLVRAGYANEIVRVQRDGHTKFKLTRRAKEDDTPSALRKRTVERGGKVYDEQVVLKNSNAYNRFMVAFTGVGTNVKADANVDELNRLLAKHRLTKVVRSYRNGGGGGDTWRSYRREAEALDKGPEEESWAKLTAGKSRGKGGRPAVKWSRRIDSVTRHGGPPITEDVHDTETLRQKFNFRAVQYGKSMPLEARAQHMHNAYGAFVDLADILGVDHHQLAHGGSLALAFGARGSGGARAHYESSGKDGPVINITATHGAGTFAHEWGHFMDNHMAARPKEEHFDARRGRASFPSEGDEAGHHPDIAQAYAEVMTAIKWAGVPSAYVELEKRREAWNATYAGRVLTPEERREARREEVALTQDLRNYQRTRNRNDADASTFITDAKHLGEYWSRPREMFARCFESYVEDKLVQQDRLNTYLVSGTRDQYRIPRGPEGKEPRYCEPYPQGEERKAIHAAIDKLVGAMKKHGVLRKAFRFMIKRWLEA